MSYENSAGLNVHNHYGPRSTGAVAGVEWTGGSTNKLSIYLTKATLADKFLPPVVLPKGARIVSAFVTVDEEFQGVTSIVIGEDGAEATNGISLVAADLAEGTREPSTPLAGEWDPASPDGLTTAQKVGMVVTGTATAGQGTLVLTYEYKARKVGT